MVLLEQSRSARMLVIGTREHVGVGRIVHGSVSHFCLDNANCPVAAHPFPPATSAASVDKRPEPATPD
jgi:nucleotide-binding universal stress UspA family protein